MKGRQPGRPTKWVFATIKEPIEIGKSPGVRFDIWEKRKKKDYKLGTLMAARSRQGAAVSNLEGSCDDVR